LEWQDFVDWPGETMIKVKRVYEQTEPDDGARFLVERLWPRGMRKQSLHMTDWLRDVAPSTELRQWFGHDPAKWTEFRRRYFAELDARPQVLQPIIEAARQGNVTLIYSARDIEHNNAVVLQSYFRDRQGLK
jgi:uncharacterized protein YeaO (DUF488 family)